MTAQTLRRGSSHGWDLRRSDSSVAVCMPIRGILYQPSNLHLSSCCQLVHLHFAYFESVTLLFHSMRSGLFCLD
jgi:hypothetical protein